MKVEEFDIGDHVECDYCGKDYTGQPDSGGLLFQSKAACPSCAPRIEAGARHFHEEHFIRARCPEGQAYAAWVLELRSHHPFGNKVRIISSDE